MYLVLTTPAYCRHSSGLFFIASHTHTHITARFPSLKVDIDSELKILLEYKERVKPMLCDTVSYMNKAIQEKKKIVIEGANATMLDIDFGITIIVWNNCFALSKCM